MNAGNTTFSKLYLPVGLCLVLLGVLCYPQTASLQGQNLTPWLVIPIFIVNGLQLDVRKVRLDGSFLPVFFSVVVINLLVGPIAGMTVGRIMAVSSGVATGLLVISSVPSTLSSGVVITGVAGGNVAWALMLTIGLSLVGLLTTPFMVAMFLGLEGSQAISGVDLLVRLVGIVLVPFVAGHVMRKLLQPRSLPAVVRLIPSTCIILAVGLALAESRHELIAMRLAVVGIIVLCSLLVHGVLLALCAGAAKVWKCRPAERAAVVFVGSQKTLPLALSVLACLGGTIGVAVVVCLVFHFLQLLLDSGIASRMGSSATVRTGERP